MENMDINFFVSILRKSGVCLSILCLCHCGCGEEVARERIDLLVRVASISIHAAAILSMLNREVLGRKLVHFGQRVDCQIRFLFLLSLRPFCFLSLTACSIMEI